MARLIAAMISVLLQSPHGRSVSKGSPWKIERDEDGDSATIQGNVLSASVRGLQALHGDIASTETLLSKLAASKLAEYDTPSDFQASELQARHHVQQSLFGRKASDADNSNGAVVKVPLLSEIQVEPFLVQQAENDPLNSEHRDGSVSASSIAAQPSDERSSGEDWPWQAAWESAGDAHSSAATAPGSDAEGVKAERSELQGQHGPLLSKSRSDTDNPNGLVVEVTLSSELLEGDGHVEPVGTNTRRSSSTVADGETDARRNSGSVEGSHFLKPAGAGSRQVLTQFGDGRYSSGGWPWESAWDSAGDSIAGGASPTPAPRALSERSTRTARSGRGAGEGWRVGSVNAAATSELRAGKREHKWSLGRKQSDTDNREGAVMKVTLNSELQEGSSAVELRH